MTSTVPESVAMLSLWVSRELCLGMIRWVDTVVHGHGCKMLWCQQSNEIRPPM